MKNRLVSIGLFCSLAFCASAQLRFEPLSIHPASVTPDKPFLLLIEDQWTDSCGGSFEVNATAEQIDLIAVLRSAQQDIGCSAIIVPFQKLVVPQEFRTDGDFADQVAVRYLYDSGNGPELRAEQTLVFSDQPALTVNAEAGSWITEPLENSGLFIDQQGDFFSAALLDYANSVSYWTYTGGRINGNVYVGEMSGYYSNVVCVTTPCPRAVPDEIGRVAMLLRRGNELVVDYQNVLRTPQFDEIESFNYRRFDFARSPDLMDLDRAIPDLTGAWVAGLDWTANSDPDFRSVDIRYSGVDTGGGLARYQFTALSAGDATRSAFSIGCQDARPVDGGFECVIEGFRLGNETCIGVFHWRDVGLNQLDTSVSCGALTEVPFRMRRL